MDNVAILLTDTSVLSWLVAGDGFMILVLALFALIMFVFAHRLNKLDTSINTLNERLDSLKGILDAVSKRPCQLETHGFCVEIKDPTGKKLEEIKHSTSN